MLQALCGIRSERLLCEQLGYNMLFRWFVGLGMEDTAWDHSTYTQNRDRRINHDAIKTLFGSVMQQAEDAKLLSAEHFRRDADPRLGLDQELRAERRSAAGQDRQQKQSGSRFQAPEAQQ